MCSILVGVEVRCRSRAPDEQVWHGRSRFVPAHDFESPESRPQPRGMIVAAGHHGANERFGRFLARAFAGEQLLANSHGEVLGVMRIARRDVRMEMLDGLSRVFDLLGQVTKLPADAVPAG